MSKVKTLRLTTWSEIDCSKQDETFKTSCLICQSYEMQERHGLHLTGSHCYRKINRG